MRVTGRRTRMKIEPATNVASSSMDAFLEELNRVAGLGSAP